MKLITAKKLDRFWRGAIEAIKKMTEQGNATQKVPGLMSPEDKEKLDGLGKLATPSKEGLMSPEDKRKLDGLGYDGIGLVVDAALDSKSTNPLQNKVVAEALNKKVTGEGLTFSVVDGILTVTYQEK